MLDQQLILIRKLRDLGAQEVTFEHIYNGDVREPAVSYIKFSEAAQLDAVLEDQAVKLQNDPRLTPEERDKLKLAARERMMYGGPLEE